MSSTWTKILTPDCLPSRDDPLYQEIVNFIRNLQHDYRIHRVNDPHSLPIGPKLFYGSAEDAEDRTAFEKRIRLRENDARLEWPTKPPPFCFNGPDGFLNSGESLSSGSLPGRGGHRGSGGNVQKGGASRYSARHVGEHGAGGHHDDCGDYNPYGADADYRDPDVPAGGRRVGGVVDQSRSKVSVYLCAHISC